MARVTRGRKGMCQNGEAGKRESILFCPEVKWELDMYCKEHKKHRSSVINEVVKQFLHSQYGGEKSD